MRWLGRLERGLLIGGTMLIGIYVAAWIHGSVLARLAVQQFESRQPAAKRQEAALGMPMKEPDFSLWSTKRIEEYKESLADQFSPAVAVLRIPKIQLEVPVLEGTDDLSLNRAVGLIAGTARPGESGNIGIAGHRDGFFRGLRDVKEGDRIELLETTGERTYVIDRIVVVDPKDISVLTPRLRPSLTLVTCYPFYFVGSAPQRYIVQASLVESDRGNVAAGEHPKIETHNIEGQSTTK
jgi:sortase A